MLVNAVKFRRILLVVIVTVENVGKPVPRARASVYPTVADEYRNMTYVPSWNFNYLVRKFLELTARGSTYCNVIECQQFVCRVAGTRGGTWKRSPTVDSRDNVKRSAVDVDEGKSRSVGGSDASPWS